MNTATTAGPADIVLVGCTKAKRATRSAARDLYDASDLFRRRRHYAEAAGVPWAILSAAAGVVAPDVELEPYDFTIAERRRPDYVPRSWAIGALQACYRLAGVAVDRPLVVEVHAGIDYVRTLAAVVDVFPAAITLVHPVAGLGIGQQKAHYAELAELAELELEPVGQLHLFDEAAA